MPHLDVHVIPGPYQNARIIMHDHHFRHLSAEDTLAVLVNAGPDHPLNTDEAFQTIVFPESVVYVPQTTKTYILGRRHDPFRHNPSQPMRRHESQQSYFLSFIRNQQMEGLATTDIDDAREDQVLDLKGINTRRPIPREALADHPVWQFLFGAALKKGVPYLAQRETPKAELYLSKHSKRGNAPGAPAVPLVLRRTNNTFSLDARIGDAEILHTETPYLAVKKEHYG